MHLSWNKLQGITVERTNEVKGNQELEMIVFDSNYFPPTHPSAT